MHYTDPKVYEFISQQTGDPIIERRTCRISGTKFPVFQSDKEFYEKISPTFGGKKYLIPFPTLCPEERWRRRVGFRNERKLYRRKCDFTGKSIISMYAPDKEYIIYHRDIWVSDVWDPLDYGRQIDFSCSFFEQFAELTHEIPHPHNLVVLSENSDYTNYAGRNKDCYYIFGNGNGHNQSCLFGTFYHQCEGVVDCHNMESCTNCYNCSFCQTCYQVLHSLYCNDCQNCIACQYCDSCTYCLGCSGLVNKHYYINNQKVSRKYYEKEKKTYLEQKNTIILSNIVPTSTMIHCVGCVGDRLENCDQCLLCWDIRESKNCRYVDNAVHDQYDDGDCSYVADCSKIYETMSLLGSQSMYFCFNNRGNSHNCYYSWFTESVQYCFGCVGLKNKSYCIFNKQYTKEEYEILVPKIIEHMQDTGERGEFFHPSLSPFGYNETVAQEYFPLTREEALARGYKRQDKEYPINVPEGMETVDAKDLPSDITQVDDSILNKAIICEVSGKPFRIIKPELAFYRKHKLPLPRKHPDIRHTERLARRPGRTLFLRKCDKCGKEMLSVYKASSPTPLLQKGELKKQLVYCEECYRKEMYG